jgi:hypothetical protein
MIGRGRAEREFSTAHTGGDLSLPDAVRQLVEPTLFPVVESAQVAESADRADAESESAGTPESSG